MVCLTGTPYDTLHGVIGLKEGTSGSLKDFGISYEQIDLLPDGNVNYDAIPEAVKGAKVAYIQRSRGYSLRPSLFVEDIEKMVKLVRQTNPDAIIMVDNCYGEFVETIEPTDVGADMVVGSLIKTRRRSCPHRRLHLWHQTCVDRAPTVSPPLAWARRWAPNLGILPAFYQGFFLAPTVTAEP